MIFYYAQLDPQNIAMGVSQLSGEVVAENMIPITEAQYNNDQIVGYLYDRATNTWIYVPPPEPTGPTSGNMPVTEV